MVGLVGLPLRDEVLTVYSTQLVFEDPLEALQYQKMLEKGRTMFVCGVF